MTAEIDPSLETLEQKHGLLKRALDVLINCNHAIRGGLLEEADAFRRRLAELQKEEEAEEVFYFTNSMQLSEYFNDVEFSTLEDDLKSITENSDGIYTVSKNMETQGLPLDTSFLELVNSVLH